MKQDIDKIKSGHKLLKEWKYQLKPVDKGYNMRTLYVNISDNTINEKPVSEEMKMTFTGGKGFGLKLLWDGVTPETKWDDPENEICIATGPIGGNTNYPGSGKSLVVSLSPLTGIPIDSNVGGYFGPYLKFSGFDALEIQGKAEKDVIIYIDGDEGKVQIFEAPFEAVDSHVVGEQIVELFAKNEEDKMNISSVSAGTGSDHAWIGCLNFSMWDKRRKGVRFKQAG
ncbi:MAG TPA: aldehyde:ferredoxin oxidoreductase, partial [Firmicutes bacterium]|nr:aldehyde:ferredoxin oxidoreductase [Bacillota bacterium]